jgi:hypothetical protein
MASNPGSHTLAAIVRIIDRELAVTPAWWIGTLNAKEVETLIYVETREGLANLVPEIASGQLASVQMRREQPPLLVGLYRPNFGGRRPNLWTCVFEGAQEEIVDLYENVGRADGLAFVALSLDEVPGVDFRRRVN